MGLKRRGKGDKKKREKGKGLKRRGKGYKKKRGKDPPARN
jgi:hypothetical protein